MARGIVKLQSASPYEQGHFNGKIVGYIIPEIILAVASEGIWVAVKGALTGLKVVLKVLKPILKGIKVAVGAIKKGAAAAKGIAIMLQNLVKTIFKSAKNSKFWKFLSKIFDDLAAFLGKQAGKITERIKKAQTYLKENLDRIKKMAREKGVDGNDPNWKTILEAIAFIKFHDALNPSPPVAAVVEELNLFFPIKGKLYKPIKSKLGGPNDYLISVNPKIPYSQGKAMEKDRIAHGGYNVRKRISQIVKEANFAAYPKHIKATTVEQAQKLSQKVAQYIPGIKVSALERKALDKGILVKFDDGAKKVWKIFKNDSPVGFNNGQKTNWMRVEVSSGHYHGHPIRIDGPNGVLELLKGSQRFGPEVRGSLKQQLEGFGLTKNEILNLRKYLE